MKNHKGTQEEKLAKLSANFVPLLEQTLSGR